ncbi:MAG: nitrogenase iron-molybdenum cofactor biosynthesis protein NifN [Coriobacteriia bacterium]
MQPTVDTLLSTECGAGRRDKVCRSRGGESCAFDGAMIVLQPIADAAHIVHGPIACCANTWEGRGVLSTVGTMHRRGFSTDLSELDIIYGGEEKLRRTIAEVIKREQPSAVFVYSTCVTGLTGEDLSAVCAGAERESGVPVLPVHAPGFVGPKNLGNRIAGEVLLERVIGTAEPPGVLPTDIVLIGEYNVAGDLDVVEPLLARAGIRILSRITGNACFEEIRWAHRARVSAVVCSRALVNVAEKLRSTYGIPFVEVSFFGSTEIARSLRLLADVLESVSPEAIGVRARVDAVIAEEEATLAVSLAPFADLRAKRAVLYSGGVKSWSMVSALRDIGIEVIAVGVKKASHEDEEKVRALLGADAPIREDISPKVIRRLMAEGGDVLVAGGRNQYLAAKEGWPFIDVNQERHTAYAGYDGLVNMARDLHGSVAFYADTIADGPDTIEVESVGRASVIDPIKQAPTAGAVLATQGVHGAVPLLHGAQGCTFLEKVLLIKHFREPIALSTTKLFTEDVVLGGSERIGQAVSALIDSSAPDLITVIPTALAEVKGDDVAVAVAGLTDVRIPVLAVRAPDYDGGMQEGYSAVVRSLLSLAVGGRTAPAQITIVAGAHLTPADFHTLREFAEAFGLTPVIVPDLAALDGSREGLSPLAHGGVTLAELRSVGRSAHTIVIGASLAELGVELEGRFDTPFTVLDAIHGLAASDRLAGLFSALSGRPVPVGQIRRRRILVDALRDAHGVLAGAPVALALEPDHALSLSALLAETGAHLTQAVVPTAASGIERITAGRVVVGDFASVECGARLLLAGSHARDRAALLGTPLLQIGFPSHHTFGAAQRVSVGYSGATTLVNDMANALAPGATNRKE